jgi:hypothetical protein
MEPDWKELSADLSPEAIELLSRNPDKIVWHKVAHNPSALPLLQSNLHKIDYYFSEPDLSDEVVDLIIKNHKKINVYKKTRDLNLMMSSVKTPRLKQFFETKIEIKDKLDELNKILYSINDDDDFQYFDVYISDAHHMIKNKYSLA